MLKCTFKIFYRAIKMMNSLRDSAFYNELHASVASNTLFLLRKSFVEIESSESIYQKIFKE